MLTSNYNHGQKTLKNISLEESSKFIELDLNDEIKRKHNILATVNRIEFNAESLND